MAKDRSEKIYSHLETIVDAMIDGVIIIDEKGVMQAINTATCQIFGYAEKELIGNNVSKLMPQPHRREHDKYIGNYLQTGEKKIIGIGREVTGLRKNGSQFPFRLSISESTLEGEKYFIGIIHDISEIVQAQRELELVNKQLEKIVTARTNDLTNTVNKLLLANSQLKTEISLREKTEAELEKALEKEKELGALKSRFVTMASHEFRTPLSTILSSASIIGRYETKDQQSKREKHINKISVSVRNMTNILEDILSLGKLEEGKIDNQPESFELVAFAHSIPSRLDAMLKSGQHIEIAAKPKKIEVSWAKNLAENILINLLTNAIKYSGENSKISLGILKQKDKIRIDISDEGIGIPADQQKHLFDRFFRASNVMNIKGTGLGLHIVCEYLSLMDGEISFQSEEGKGSVFSIVLPQHQTK